VTEERSTAILCGPRRDCADPNPNRWHCMRGHADETRGIKAKSGICPLPKCEQQGANREVTADPVNVAATVLAAVNPTPTWHGMDAAFLWEVLCNDSDEERHARLTSLIAAAAEMLGAQTECADHAETVEGLRIELDEQRAKGER